MNNYLCPVCGYAELEEPPINYNICPCCGTEFGYHDYRLSHSELRHLWIAAGAPWHSPFISPPLGWNPFVQLSDAGYIQANLVTLQEDGLEDRIPELSKKLSPGLAPVRAKILLGATKTTQTTVFAKPSPTPRLVVGGL